MPDDELIRRPIVILGAPRSGTTLLSQLLRHHPDVYLANELRIIWKYGNDAKSDMLQPADARPDVVKHIRSEFAKRVREEGKSRLVEKSPSNSLRVGFVDHVLPDAIYVHMMRAGLESVLSIRKYWEKPTQLSSGRTRTLMRRRLKEIRLRQVPHYAGEFFRRVGKKFLPSRPGSVVWGPRLPGLSEMARDLSPLEVAAWQWRSCVEHTCRVGRTLPPDRYTECPLEDFDAAELSKLLAFCGLAPAAEVDAAFQERFDAQAPAARSKAADEEEVNEVNGYIAPTVAWLETLEPLHRHRE